MTDTAGYTDIMFGCYRILDSQLSPRMADSEVTERVAASLSPTAIDPCSL
jgi:TnpA family transposase